MTRDDDVYARSREFMCRCFGNCVGCPIRILAKHERLTCTEFRNKFPERDRRTVMEWRLANLKLSQGVKPDPV